MGNFNKNNFWNNSLGTWEIVSENDNYFSAVETAFQLAEQGAEMNFNNDGTVFYARGENFVIRVAEIWGQIHTCSWFLNKDKRQPFVVGKIYYKDLINENKGE